LVFASIVGKLGGRLQGFSAVLADADLQDLDLFCLAWVGWIVGPFVKACVSFVMVLVGMGRSQGGGQW